MGVEAAHLHQVDACSRQGYAVLEACGGLAAVDATAQHVVDDYRGRFNHRHAHLMLMAGEGDFAVIKMEVPEGTAEGSYPVTINNFRVNGTPLDVTVLSQVKVVASIPNPETAIQLTKANRETLSERVYNIVGQPTTISSKGIKLKKGRKFLVK